MREEPFRFDLTGLIKGKLGEIGGNWGQTPERKLGKLGSDPGNGKLRSDPGGNWGEIGVRPLIRTPNPLELFDITAPPDTERWRLALFLVLVVSSGLVAWTWVVLSNYARCPCHITVPHISVVFAALSSTTFLFVMLVLEVVD